MVAAVASVATSLKVAAGCPVAADVVTVTLSLSLKDDAASLLASVSASLKDDAVPLVAFVAVDYDVAPPIAPVARGKHFNFPPVLEDSPSFSILVKRVFWFQVYSKEESHSVARRELEKWLSIACSVYFVDKGGDSRFEVRDVG